MCTINYKVLKNELFGRYMVANRHIKAGELVLLEKPVLLGPQLDGPLICFGCCRNVRRIGFVLCKKCNTAILCSSKCTGSLHTEEECEHLKQLGIDGYILEENEQCIFPLRCLLLRQFNPKIWEIILELEPHLEDRRNTTIWRRNQINVEQVLRKINVLTHEDINNETLQRVCGILDVNTFEVRPPSAKDLHINNPGVECLRGLYLKAALMAHDCIGNTLLSVDNNFQLMIKASVDIPENHPIFFNYANVLHGTIDRKQHLREGKYFDCGCSRCSDPTELGTDLSSLICHVCHKGKIRIEDVKNVKSNWICSDCKKTFSHLLIKTTIDEGRRRIEETCQTNVEALENLLKILLRTFSRNHFLILELKQILIGLYGRSNRNNLIKKISSCKEILDVISIIEPGISRLKAITLYQLQFASVVMAHNEYQDKQINLENLMMKLLDAEKKLKEAVKFLIHEPTESPEGNITRMALSELKMLRSSINNIQKDLLLDDSSNKLIKPLKEKAPSKDMKDVNKNENCTQNTVTVSSKSKKKRNRKKK